MLLSFANLVPTFAASLGMSLPISTPPNALAYASGHVETKQMAKVGVLLGIIGILITYAMLYLLDQMSYIG